MTHIILFDGQGAMPSSSALRSILSNTAGIQRFQEFFVHNKILHVKSVVNEKNCLHGGALA